MPSKGRSEMTFRSLPGILAAAWTGSVLLASLSCAQNPPAASPAISSPSPRQARIWFYRDLSIYSSMATPYVRLNGVAVGASYPGGAFYRDVPPGRYHISADSYLDDPEQDRNVDLAPGQEIYAKILPSDRWIEGGGGGGRGGGSGYHRETFYVWLYPAEAARPVIAQSPFYGEGTLMAAPPAP
jgi:hypothetical protein